MIYVLSGGGNGLNFRVFSGATAPSSPKLYDIWVKTSVTMTKAWLLPSTWTTTGTGPVAILCNTTKELPANGTNVLAYKKDSNPATELRLTLSGCKQLQSGAWKSLDAYVYKNSQWVQFSSTWNGELYQNGNQYTDVTGGWTGATTVGTNYLELVHSNDYYRYMQCTNNIDVTNFTKATLTVKNAANWASIQLKVGTAVGEKQNEDAEGGAVTIQLDISGVSGSVTVQVGSKKNYNSATFRMYSLILS